MRLRGTRNPTPFPHVTLTMLPATPPPLTDRARWAVGLYKSVGDTREDAAHARDRLAGIRRYKGAPAARVRADLEPVLRAYPDGTIQYSAAAYVLARYGVDTERNVARLFDSARMNRRGDDPADNAESLPEALGDLWVVRRSPTALHLLLTMPSDGEIADIQSEELVRALRATPDRVLRAAARIPKGWDSLAFGAVDGLPSGRGIHEKALLAKLRRDAKRYE